MGSGAPAVLASTRDRWLAARREILGASEVAAVLGEDPRRGPFAVWAEKVGQIESHETQWMRWGRRVEGAIADGYTDETGRPAVDLGAHEIQRHPDIPFLGATLDRMTSGSAAHPAPAEGDGPLECKAVGVMKAREWRESPPDVYQIQLQIQMSCTSKSWGSLVALIGGLQLEWHDMPRNDAFLAAILPELEAFWMKVQRREPPEADGKPGTTAAIKALWPTAEDKTIALDQEAMEIVAAWERAEGQKKAAGDEAEALENELRVRMGDASFAWLLDGSQLTLKTTGNRGYTRAVKPYSYRTLRHVSPRIRRRS